MKQFNQDNMKSISDYINNFYEDNPFTKHLGVDIVSIDKGNVCVSLTIKHEHTNVYGIAKCLWHSSWWCDYVPLRYGYGRSLS